LSDSHAHVFKAGKFAIKYPNYDWSLCYVMGAALFGLENKISKTKTMDKFIEQLDTVKPDIKLSIIGVLVNSNRTLSFEVFHI
jgi:hypothetical protein